MFTYLLSITLGFLPLSLHSGANLCSLPLQLLLRQIGALQVSQCLLLRLLASPVLLGAQLFSLLLDLLLLPLRPHGRTALLQFLLSLVLARFVARLLLLDTLLLALLLHAEVLGLRANAVRLLLQLRILSVVLLHRW